MKDQPNVVFANLNKDSPSKHKDMSTFSAVMVSIAQSVKTKMHGKFYKRKTVKDNRFFDIACDPEIYKSSILGLSTALKGLKHVYRFTNSSSSPTSSLTKSL